MVSAGNRKYLHGRIGKGEEYMKVLMMWIMLVFMWFRTWTPYDRYCSEKMVKKFANIIKEVARPRSSSYGCSAQCTQRLVKHKCSMTVSQQRRTIEHRPMSCCKHK